MKFGCIIKILAIIIVILGTSFYLYDKHGKDFITKSTEKAKELAIEQIEKMVDDFSKKEIENPLKEKFAKMLKELETKKDEYTEAEFDQIVNKVKDIVKNNNLDDSSLEDLNKMIQ